MFRYLLLTLIVSVIPDFAHSEVQTSLIHYEVDGVTMQGYLAYDDAIDTKRPGVLVVHEWWGHNEYARRRAEMLAELGYTALAVDMYGEGKLADHPDQATEFMNEALANMDKTKARFLAAEQALKNHPTTDPDKIAAIGYCFGGGVVLNMARLGVDLDAVVSFHGSLASSIPPKPDSIKARILVCHGAADSFTTEQQITDFKRDMTSSGADFQFISYPGVLHSFTNPEADDFARRFNMPLAYDAKADRSSWATMQTFLKQAFSH